MAVAIEKVTLPKMGINRHTPKAVVYGQHKLGGMVFSTIETIQDQKEIIHWLRHLRLGKETSKDFKITLSAAQLSSGLTKSLLNNMELDLPYPEEGKISHLQATLKKPNGKLHIEGVWVPSLQRQGNRVIMEVIT